MIDILGDRFIGMFKEQTENGIALRLEVDFKSVTPALRWTVFNKMGDNGDIIFVTQKIHNNYPACGVTSKFHDIYHVIGMEGVITFEDLIKHSKHIIDFNMEVEEKKILLNEKFEELGELFTKHSIDELRTLQFVFSEGHELFHNGRIYSKEIFEKEFERDLDKPQLKKRKPRKTKEKPVEDVVLEEKEETTEDIQTLENTEEITEINNNKIQ